MKQKTSKALVVDQDPQQGLILVQFLSDLLDPHYIRPADVINNAEKILPHIFVLRFQSIHQMQKLIQDIREHPVFFESGVICIHENKDSLFKAGADYVFENANDLNELYWAIYSLLRRLTVSERSTTIHIQNFKLNTDTLEVINGGKAIKIDPLQMKLLVSFAQHPDRLLSREWFKSFVWQNPQISNRSIDAQISKLKKILPTLNSHLESVYGQGYIYRIKKQRAS